MKRWILVVFALSLSVSSWGQLLPSASSTSSPEAPAVSLPLPEPSWTRLDSMLEELEKKATASAERSERLALELEQVRTDLVELSARLSVSETKAALLSSSLEHVELSLQASSQALSRVQGLLHKREAELWLWKGGTAAGILGLILAILWGLGR